MAKASVIDQNTSCRYRAKIAAVTVLRGYQSRQIERRYFWNEEEIKLRYRSKEGYFSGIIKEKSIWGSN
jgi:hypothetical protein